jgi:hypothetical protein
VTQPSKSYAKAPNLNQTGNTTEYATFLTLPPRSIRFDCNRVCVDRIGHGLGPGCGIAVHKLCPEDPV